MNDQSLQFLWNTDKPIAELWAAACCDPDFLEVNHIHVDPTKDDEKEARAIVFQAPSAPQKPTTPGSAVAVKRLLSRYDFSMQDDSARLRTYITARLLDLAESEKESIALGALEKLGKIADVGLFETKITVDIGKRSDADLESQLATLVARYANGVYAVD